MTWACHCCLFLVCWWFSVYTTCCRHIITCGSDGDVRVYNGFSDNDPVSYRIGDAVYCVCCKVSSPYLHFSPIDLVSNVEGT